MTCTLVLVLFLFVPSGVRLLVVRRRGDIARQTRILLLLHRPRLYTKF